MLTVGHIDKYTDGINSITLNTYMGELKIMDKIYLVHTIQSLNDHHQGRAITYHPVYKL